MRGRVSQSRAHEGKCVERFLATTPLELTPVRDEIPG
jgi:hypothetical protein